MKPTADILASIIEEVRPLTSKGPRTSESTE